MIFRLRFPSYVFAVALLAYTITLSHGVTLGSLPITAKVAGWDWLPMAGQPVLWLLTLPIRGLPAGWVAMALNFFAALCGAATLGILAHSVRLMNRSGGQGWIAKIPIAIACVICGAEFSYWQSATAFNGEALDILLFAAIIACLMEFNRHRQPAWLDAAAFLWGLCMAENCLLFLVFPLFILALIALKRFSFLNQAFLIRTAFLLFAGTAIYFAVPLVNSLNPYSPWKFFQAWRMSFSTSRQILGTYKFYFWSIHRVVGLIVLFYFLIAGLPFLVRFDSGSRRIKTDAQRFQAWAHGALRILLLAALLWLAFDPLPGPRQLIHKQTGLALPLLTFDYLAALTIGFIVGNFLRNPSRPSRKQRSRRRSRDQSPANNLLPFGFAILASMMFVALVARNISAIWEVNRHSLESFGELAVKSLPPGGGIVLSDEPERMLIFRAALSHHREAHSWCPVNTRLLSQPDYRATLEKMRPGGWLSTNLDHELSPAELIALLGRQSSAARIFYLNSSFGYFFERFYLQPLGFIYELKTRPVDNVIPPFISEKVTEQEQFWDAAWTRNIRPLAKERPTTESALRKLSRIAEEKLGLAPIPAAQEYVLGEWSSAALNWWGVELQQIHQLKAAHERFEEAQAVKTNNFVAMFNLECNSNLQAGLKMGLQQTADAARWLGDDDRQIGLLLEHCGPFDQPVFCYLLGCVFEKAGLPRQAADELVRASILAPDAVASQVVLAQVYATLHRDDKVFELVRRLHPLAKSLPATNTLDVQLSVLEAFSWVSQTNRDQARTVLQTVVDEHLNDDAALDLVTRAYVSLGYFTNALQLVKRQLATAPDDATHLVKLSSILMLMGKSSEAIPWLNRAIASSPTSIAYLNRAMANLQNTNLAEARADFFEAERFQAEPYLVHYGLAEVALQESNRNTAIQQFAICLTNAPQGSVRWKDVNARLKAVHDQDK